MAFVFNTIRRRPDIGKTIVEITLDASSYASGGIPLTNAQLGMLTTPDHVNVEFSTGDGFDAAWIASTNAVKIYKTSTGATSTEVVAADLSTSMKLRLDVIGLPVV